LLDIFVIAFTNPRDIQEAIACERHEADIFSVRIDESKGTALKIRSLPINDYAQNF
jgi:hypothetical protein